MLGFIIGLELVVTVGAIQIFWAFGEVRLV
jgi:hypothetical protein